MASHLVGQHQQTSFATPINGAAGDATVVLGNDNATVTSYNAHDIDPTIHVQDSTAAVFGATPAGTAGRKWMTNDVGGVYLYFDTGSVWVEVNYQRAATNGTVVIVSTTTPQLTVEYDGSHTSTFSVSSAGVLTINATSTVTITPATTITGALTLSAALTYGGVTLSNAVTGTGNMVLSASPTLTGTLTAAAITASGKITTTVGGTVLALSGTASGTYGSDVTARWFRSDGSTLRALMGFNTANNQVFQLGTIETGGSVVITSDNNVTAITIASTQAVTFAAGISATTGTFSTSVKTTSGTGSAPDATATTFYAVPGVGTYIVTAYTTAGPDITGVAIVVNGSLAVVPALTAIYGTSLSLSSSNVQFTQSTGATRAFAYTVLRIA